VISLFLIFGDLFSPVWRGTALSKFGVCFAWEELGSMGSMEGHKFPQIRKTTCQELGIWGSATEVSLGSLYAGAVTKAGGLLMWGSFA
jgi:hypothetical protein